MMITPPLNTPAEPSPAIARPTIKAFEVGATPQISDPSSKSAMAERKITFMLKWV
jgi:hypothetical protein